MMKKISHITLDVQIVSVFYMFLKNNPQNNPQYRYFRIHEIKNKKQYFVCIVFYIVKMVKEDYFLHR